METTQSRVKKREEPPEVFGGLEQIRERIEDQQAMLRMVQAGANLDYGLTEAEGIDDLTHAQQYELRYCRATRHFNITESPKTLPRALGSTFCVDGANERARKAGLDYSLTDEEWDRIREGFDRRCAYCGSSRGPLELEHVVPICQGGGTEKHNVVPACRSCNSDKGAKSPKKFIGEKATEALFAKLRRINP